MTTRAERIERQLQTLDPQRLEVINESARHHGHAGDDGSGESHFKIILVSDRFTGLSRIDRQRLVYDILEGELACGLHALSLQLATIKEYVSLLKK